jgi:hypothetical protein
MFHHCTYPSSSQAIKVAEIRRGHGKQIRRGIHRAVVEALPRSLFGQLSAYISVAPILAIDIKKPIVVF